MAPYQLLVSLFITLVLTSVHNIGCCYVLKGSVTCVDCDHHSDLSGIKVSVKLQQSLEKVATAVTAEEDGTFETNLHWKLNIFKQLSCKFLGTKQMFVSEDIMDTKIVKVQEDNYSYTISEPLSSTQCLLNPKK
ncbi:hypothetical protein HAX54_018453 [Datura stramonium]|uniref:Uncharacterized protein n=1 Tax=Datura stramonium TaxID=4076 RepID=A0ABS8UMG1_DATST|nr:hypothetical protein [Datura stramonium]